jgi:hypothetical protein
VCQILFILSLNRFEPTILLTYILQMMCDVIQEHNFSRKMCVGPNYHNFPLLSPLYSHPHFPSPNPPSPDPLLLPLPLILKFVFRFQNWKKRWFVLSHYELRYYREQTDSMPIRTLDLQECLECAADNSKRQPYCFR